MLRFPIAVCSELALGRCGQTDSRGGSYHGAASLAWTNWPLFTVGMVPRGDRNDEIWKILGFNRLRVARDTLHTSPSMHAKTIILATVVSTIVLSPALFAQNTTTNAESALAKRGDVILTCDFETDDWWTAWGSRREPAGTLLVGDAKAYGRQGRSLQVTTPRGEHMGTSFAYKFRERLGSEPDEIYFRYCLKFDPDWKHATSGGKLPGISGTYGKAGWGGRKVNGTDGWSARGLFETRNGADSTVIGFYCYHADMRGRYGENWRFQPRLEHGRWYCVEQYCKLNTPGDFGGRGKNDGILRGWIDGQVAFEKTDIRFRDVDALKIEEVWVNVYHGGETPVPNEDIHLYLDNLVIARQPIGPVQ